MSLERFILLILALEREMGDKIVDLYAVVLSVSYVLLDAMRLPFRWTERFKYTGSSAM